MDTLSSWALFLACAFVAEIIGTMAGFGAATILTPVAAVFMDMRAAIALVAWFHLCGNASRLVFFGRFLRWRIWFLFGLAGIACSGLGAIVTTQLSSSSITLAFGLFLAGYVLLSWPDNSRLRLPARPGVLLGGGAASGFIAGLLGTGGAIRSACLLAFGLPKEVYLGTSAAIALAVDAARLPVYAAGGLVPGRLVPVALSLIAVAFAGAWVGQRLIRRWSAQGFRRFVLVILALMAAKLIWDGWYGVA